MGLFNKVIILSLSLLSLGFVKTNQNSGNLFNVPSDARYVEDFLTINIGESINLDVEDGVLCVSNNNKIAKVSSSGKITGMGYGRTKIQFIKNDVTEVLDVLVKRNVAEYTLTQASHFPSTQGKNGFYVYNSDNGDIENNLEVGLTSLNITPQSNYNNSNGYWNNISFIGNDHFGGRGSGALSYKATYAGNYTFEYSAWLLGSIRKNSEYSTWNVDGFTTGLAKKDKENNISLLVSNVGTKESVVADETRYHIGAVTLDLKSNEEVMMFFCSNGSGDADEVYTEFGVIQNEITGTPLYIIPENCERFENNPLIYIDEELDIKARSGATVTSSDSNIIEITANNKLFAKGFGNATIAVHDSEETDTFEVFTAQRSNSNLISQNNSFPKEQGEHNFYIYYSTNKDYEAALPAIEQMNNSYYSGGQWWNEIVFANNERVFCNGTGAIGFKVPENGSYTINYSAYLMTSIRNNPEYVSAWNVDGFTTGLVKKASNGALSYLKVNVGTKQSVVDVKTMRQCYQTELNLNEGEEILFFFNSNTTADADEIMTEFNIFTNSSSHYNGNLEFNSELPLISDVGILYINETTKLVTNYTGNLHYSSSNPEVASIDQNGNVTGLKVGTTVLKAYDTYASNELVLAVKSPNENELLFNQEDKLPNEQGINNSFIYYSETGDYEENISQGLTTLDKMPDAHFNSSEYSWWNNITFVNRYRVFTRGIGAISYQVSRDGNYRLDYYAYLLDEIRFNPAYGGWDVDGFSVGLAKKSVDGQFTVIDFVVNTKNGVIDNKTRFMMNECVVHANEGDELMFFWISNGIPDCDEIATNFTVQRVYLDGETKPTEINLSLEKTNLNIGEETTVIVELNNYNNQAKVWSSSDEKVATVQDGVIKAISSGRATITLTIDESSSSIIIDVNYELSYHKSNNQDLSLEFSDVYGDLYIYRIYVNDAILSSSYYSSKGSIVTINNSYLQELEAKQYEFKLITDQGVIIANVTIEEDKTQETKEKKNNALPIIIACSSVGGAGLIALVIFIVLKKKKGA